MLDKPRDRKPPCVMCGGTGRIDAEHTCLHCRALEALNAAYSRLMSDPRGDDDGPLNKVTDAIGEIRRARAGGGW